MCRLAKKVVAVVEKGDDKACAASIIGRDDDGRSK
jgi:hypothetical protein